MLVDYPTKEYCTFECLEPKAIVPSGTRKNGSTLPSESSALKQIIKETATMRDNWDESDDGKELKKTHQKGCSIQTPLGSDRYFSCCTRRHGKCG